MAEENNNKNIHPSTREITGSSPQPCCSLLLFCFSILNLLHFHQAPLDELKRSTKATTQQVHSSKEVRWRSHCQEIDRQINRQTLAGTSVSLSAQILNKMLRSQKGQNSFPLLPANQGCPTTFCYLRGKNTTVPLHIPRIKVKYCKLGPESFFNADNVTLSSTAPEGKNVKLDDGKAQLRFMYFFSSSLDPLLKKKPVIEGSQV